MRKMLGIALVLGVVLTATAEERGTSPSILARLWPASVKFPAGMKLYKPTEYAQRSVVLNSQPHLTPYHFTQDDGGAVNPNRVFPYTSPGGLHAASDWTSVFGLRVPEGESIRVWTDTYYQITNARPVNRWEYPVGTVAADILVRKSTGEPFELRILSKTEDGWKALVPWQADRLPPGYQATDRKCLTCHQDAGDATRYGLTVRGNDFLFSPPIHVEGTVTLDDNRWPLDRWQGAVAHRTQTVQEPATYSAPPTYQPPMYQGRGLFRRR